MEVFSAISNTLCVSLFIPVLLRECYSTPCNVSYRMDEKCNSYGCVSGRTFPLRKLCTIQSMPVHAENKKKILRKMKQTKQ